MRRLRVPTAEEHLRQDTGNMIMQLMFQLAMLKAEADRLREDLARANATQDAAR
jgi:uncharacterized small protein (DUF1192 family)